jgi:hypothetical protein
VGFEICEDALTDVTYFNAVYKEAAELCAHLCKEFNLDPLKDGVLICHSEGYSRGLASNHGDVMHWWPKQNKSMDTFRADVKKLLDAATPTTPTTPATPITPSTPTTAIKAGDTVKLAADATYYDGKAIPAWVKAQNWIVSSIKGDRAVIDKNVAGTNSINSPVNIKFLSVVGATVPTVTTSAPFQPYLVKVTADSLNIRKGSGTNTAIVGTITDHGVYTIIEEKDGFGKLKSGAGWIALSYTKLV